MRKFSVEFRSRFIPKFSSLFYEMKKKAHTERKKQSVFSDFNNFLLDCVSYSMYIFIFTERIFRRFACGGEPIGWRDCGASVVLAEVRMRSMGNHINETAEAEKGKAFVRGRRV